MKWVSVPIDFYDYMWLNIDKIEMGWYLPLFVWIKILILKNVSFDG